MIKRRPAGEPANQRAVIHAGVRRPAAAVPLPPRPLRAPRTLAVPTPAFCRQTCPPWRDNITNPLKCHAWPRPSATRAAPTRSAPSSARHASAPPPGHPSRTPARREALRPRPPTRRWLADHHDCRGAAAYPTPVPQRLRCTMKTHEYLNPAENALNRARLVLFDVTFNAGDVAFRDACQAFQAATWNYLAACRAARNEPPSRAEQDLADYDPPCPADLPAAPDARGQLLLPPATAVTRVT